MKQNTYYYEREKLNSYKEHRLKRAWFIIAVQTSALSRTLWHFTPHLNATIHLDCIQKTEILKRVLNRYRECQSLRIQIRDWSVLLCLSFKHYFTYFCTWKYARVPVVIQMAPVKLKNHLFHRKIALITLAWSYTEKLLLLVNERWLQYTKTITYQKYFNTPETKGRGKEACLAQKMSKIDKSLVQLVVHALR